MKDNKVNYKLVNIVLIITIFCLLYISKGLWLGIVGKIMQIIFPFIVAFAIAYALYPLVKKLRQAGFPKWLAILLVCVITIGFLITIIILLVPMIYDQVLLFLTNISTFISDFADKYELNLGVLETSISDISKDIIKTLGTYISDGAINILNASINVISSFIIILFVSIYLLADMDKIRKGIKNTLSKGRKKIYNYIKTLDHEVSQYFIGFGKNILVQLVEYTTVFFLIGHPNYLILGILAAVSTIIPYFGGLIVNIIALLIASVVSPSLFYLTLIVCLVCPQIDGYVIAPRIYGKSNKIHPLVNIFAVFAGGILGGFWGIVISMPIAIIIITTYKYFKKDINNKFTEIKEKS